MASVPATDPQTILTETTQRALASATAPAWVIDAPAALILAANADGLKAMAIDRDALPFALDGAMPAVLRLRGLQGGPSEPRVPLVFWTIEGMRRLICAVRATPDAGGSQLLLVSVIADGDGEPVTARSDSETLAEIARRIREGQAAVRSPVPPEPNPSAKENEPVISQVVSDEPPPPAAFKSAADTSRDRDLARLAHELKTPLSAIAAAAEIIRDDRLGKIGDKRYAGYAASMYANAHHGLTLIERMLSGAGETGAAAPRTAVAAIDANALIRGVVKALAPLAAKSGHKIALTLAKPLPAIRADETALTQVFNNLLANALKFTPPGRGIRIETVYDRRRPLRISVIDEGRGMTKAELEAALSGAAAREPFADGTGGHGLGLPIVRRLVEANSASIKITSRPGKGTTVSLYFDKSVVSKLKTSK